MPKDVDRGKGQKRPRDKNDNTINLFKVDILKSPLDSKETHVIELANELKVIVVSTLEKDLKPDIYAKVNPSTNAFQSVESFNAKYFSSGQNPGPPAADAPKEEIQVQSGPEKKIQKFEDDLEEKAIIGISVASGSMLNPEEFLGMAHLTEHAVFQGSVNYPEPYGIFRMFDKDTDTLEREDNGQMDSDGSDSEDEEPPQFAAFTSDLATTFTLGAKLKHFEKWAAYICELVAAPTLEELAVRRDVNSVNAEYILRSNDDNRLCFSVIADQAKDGHPYKTLTNSCGNAKTLDKKGLVTRLREWKAENYCSQNMSAIIVAPWTLERLTSFANKHLSQIPSARDRGKPSPFERLIKDWGTETPFGDLNKFNRIFRMCPIYDYEQMTLTWALPQHLGKDFDGKSVEFLAILFEIYSRRVELVSSLKNDGLVTSLTCSIPPAQHLNLLRNEFFIALMIDIELTGLGMKNWSDIVSRVNQTLRGLEQVLDGPEVRALFDQWRQSEADVFHYRDSFMKPHFILSALESHALHPIRSKELPLSELNTHLQLVKSFPLANLKNALGHLNPNECNILLLSSSFTREDVPEDSIYTEPGYGTKYSAVNIHPDLISKWSAASPLTFKFSEVKGGSGIITCPDNYESPSQQYFMMDFGRVFLRFYRFKCVRGMVPLTAYLLFFSSDALAVPTPKTEAALTLWSLLLNSSLNEDEQGNLDPFYNAKFMIGYGTIILFILGMTEHLMDDQVFVKAIKTFQESENRVQERWFEDVKSLAVSRATNITMDGFKYARDLQNTALLEDYASIFQIRDEIAGMTLGSFKEFVTVYKQRMQIGGIVVGCIPQGHSGLILSTLKDLPFQPMESEKKVFHSKELPIGEKCIRVKSNNPVDQNSVIINYYSFGMHGAVCKRIARRIATEAFIHLRGVEQLAYVVQVSHEEDFGAYGITILVIFPAKKFTPEYIDEKISDFLRKFYNDKVKHSKNIPFKRAYEKYLLENVTHFRKLSVQVCGTAVDPTGNFKLSSPKLREKMRQRKPKDKSGKGDSPSNFCLGIRDEMAMEVEETPKSQQLPLNFDHPQYADLGPPEESLYMITDVIGFRNGLPNILNPTEGPHPIEKKMHKKFASD